MPFVAIPVQNDSIRTGMRPTIPCTVEKRMVQIYNQPSTISLKINSAYRSLVDDRVNFVLEINDASALKSRKKSSNSHRKIFPSYKTQGTKGRELSKCMTELSDS